MSMRILTELTTKLVEEKSGDEVPKSEVLMNGTPTGKLVSGAIMEAAVQWEDFYLLFMTDDTPYEEMLGIHLFDKNWNLLDAALLGGIYSSGSFSAIELNEPNTISFGFIGDAIWTIELLSHPSFRVPFISDAEGVKRPLGFSRHFIVRGNPRPQTA